jgi:hypothetical protein
VEDEATGETVEESAPVEDIDGTPWRDVKLQAADMESDLYVAAVTAPDRTAVLARLIEEELAKKLNKREGRALGTAADRLWSRPASAPRRCRSQAASGLAPLRMGCTRERGA